MPASRTARWSQALGYRIQRVFVGVFVAGAALAGLGGAMWGFYREQFTVAIGADLLVQMLIIVIIGGLGSVRRLLRRCDADSRSRRTTSASSCPTLRWCRTSVVMIAVLLWRPRGLYPAGR